MASAYLVTLDRTKGGYNLEQDIDAVVVYADSTSQAKDLAKAMMGADANLHWANATVTAIAAEAELEGWTFNIGLQDNNSPFTVITASYVATDAQVIDDVGAGLAAALIVAGVAGAAYNSGTNVLTIVETTDGMGDWHINVFAYPPSGGLYSDPLTSVTGFFGAVTAEGASGIARKSTLVAAFPKPYGKFSQKG